MKKKYIAPSTIEFDLGISPIMQATSSLQGNGDNQDVERQDDEYNGEIKSRRRSVWDEEEEY
ncbi:MAG: hypothetical protein IJ841_01175 [Prevotella sp.]|nr:hypothetical protein [Prevotella sp.]